ncbi:hypothetical protein, partial [Rhizobium sp. H4]|uniref:hypothetical protein n=1 Tax=Rhizobium sp. H4 TaxID=2035449 RepID=UPI001AEC97F3
PSFSEWAYRTNPFSKSTALFEKNHFSFKQLFLQMIFRTARRRDRFPDSDPPHGAGEVNILRLFAGKNALSSPSAPTSSQSAGLNRHTIHTGKGGQTALLCVI